MCTAIHCKTSLLLNPTQKKSQTMKSTITTSSYFPEAVYEDPDALKVKSDLRNDLEKTCTFFTYICCLFSVSLSFASLILRWDQSIVTAVNELEVKMKPVPRPRSKMHPKPLPSTDSNIPQSAEKEDNTSNVQVSFSGLFDHVRVLV